MTESNKSNNVFNRIANSIKIKLYYYKYKLKLIAFFIAFIVFFVVIINVNTFYIKYSCYKAGIEFFNANRYIDAVNKLALAGDYRDAKDKLKLASKSVFGQLDDCLKQIDIEMVICPAGSYVETKKDNNFKEIQHTVIISSPFAIGKYEITQGQYVSIMGKNIANKTDLLKPLNCVTWNDAKEFCEKLNKMFGDKLPENYKFDLPTDSQWEYACRSGKNSKFYEGPTEGNLNDIAWFSNNSEGISIVGQKKANAWGIYDMYGNVWEWCNNSSEKCLMKVKNPIKAHADGSCRILCGGSYTDEYISFDKNRYCAIPTSRLIDVGFRLAFVPK